MRPSWVSTVLFLFIAFTSSSTALESLLNSPCSVQCGNVQGSTTGSDIVCNNGDFTGTAAGTTFQGCVTCQLASTYVDPDTKQTDLQWGLYNLRYALSWCLFGYPNNTAVGDSPCITSTACGPLQNAIEFDSLSSSASEFGYCALFTTASIPKCSACLSVETSQYYLLNFMTALNGACQQQPAVGHTLSLQGSLFSMTPTNITSPSPSASGTYTPSNSKVSLGAKIGIALACVVLVFGIIGFCIIWRGKRRRRNIIEQQKENGYSFWVAAQQDRASVISSHLHMSEAGGSAVSGRGPFYDSPLSTRPLVSNVPWRAPRREDETPISASSEKGYRFSPYSSQYASPVSAVDQINMYGQQWPIDRKGSVGGYSESLGRFPSRSRSVEKREVLGNEFELQTVAPVYTAGSQQTGAPVYTVPPSQKVVPVLQHPGHGRRPSQASRTSRSSQVSLALTEEDHRKGNAL